MEADQINIVQILVARRELKRECNISSQSKYLAAGSSYIYMCFESAPQKAMTGTEMLLCENI